MKKNLLKRIGAVALAVAVSLTMGVTSFATTSVGQLVSGDAIEAGNGNDYSGASFTVVLDKNSDVTAPGTQFTYSIENGTAVSATANGPAIKAGEGKVSFAPGENVTVDNTATTATVKLPSGTTTVTVPMSFADHSVAGIYRYNITQSALDNAQTAAGFKTNANNGNAVTYYLDVYVNKDKKVYAAALANSTAPASGDTRLQDSNKVPGFTNLYSYDSTSETTESYDVTISKTLGEGGMEDPDQAFPFNVNITLPQNSTYVDCANMSFTIQGGTAESFGTAATANASGVIGDLSGTLIGGKSITIKGLPAGTVVKVKETVEAGEQYKISSSVEKMDSSATVGAYATPSDSTVNTESDYVTTGTVKVNTADDGTIDYLNYRTTISPTNVVIKFAPYLFILGAAIVLLVLMRRRKAHNDAE